MTSCGYGREMNRDAKVFGLVVMLLFSLISWYLLGLLKGQEKARDKI